MEKCLQRTWAEIDLDALCFNITNIRKITNKNAKIMAVVKANAYGHGIEMVATTLLKNGADEFAVSCVSEAIELRKYIKNAPILILSYVDEDTIDEIVDYNLMPTVFSYSFAKKISDYATKHNATVKIHIKVDTGMSRLGFSPDDESVEEIKKISKLDGIEIDGLFTHFATADEADTTYTTYQATTFAEFAEKLENAGVKIPVKHAANSAATIMRPELNFDMVRPGIILYGCYPSDEIDRAKLPLKPVMALKTKIVQVKSVEKGTTVSYGRRFTTDKKTTLAVIPVGYADGLSRALSGKTSVIVNGNIVPIVGNICMDQCMIDVTGIDNVNCGDVVTVFGSDKGSVISAEETAKHTISYELLCAVGRRIPRVYLKDNKVTHITDYLE